GVSGAGAPLPPLPLLLLPSSSPPVAPRSSPTPVDSPGGSGCGVNSSSAMHAAAPRSSATPGPSTRRRRPTLASLLEALPVPEAKQTEIGRYERVGRARPTTACEEVAHVGTIGRMNAAGGAPLPAPAVRVQNVVKRVRDGSSRRTVLDDVS